MTANMWVYHGTDDAGKQNRRTAALRERRGLETRQLTNVQRISPLSEPADRKSKGHPHLL